MSFYAGILGRKIERSSEENKEGVRKDTALWHYANLITDNEFTELMGLWNEKYSPVSGPEESASEAVLQN